jgi:hypothetical protein
VILLEEKLQITRIIKWKILRGNIIHIKNIKHLEYAVGSTDTHGCNIGLCITAYSKDGKFVTGLTGAKTSGGS